MSHLRKEGGAAREGRPDPDLPGSDPARAGGNRFVPRSTVGMPQKREAARLAAAPFGRADFGRGRVFQHPRRSTRSRLTGPLP